MAFSPLASRPTLWPGGLSVLVPPPLIFDASVREEHGDSFAISSSPLENGSVVTDHVLPLPGTLLVEAILTDHPGLPTNVISGRFRTEYSKLRAIAATRQPFDFSTTLRIYTGMIIERISAPQSVESGSSVKVTLTMRKLEIATIDQAQVLADAALAVALGEQDLGQLAPEIDAAL